jgi:hypothetical protein
MIEDDVNKTLKTLEEEFSEQERRIHKRYFAWGIGVGILITTLTHILLELIL